MAKSIEQRAIEAIHGTWQAIGYDVLAASGETEGSIESSTIREVVADADRLETYGGDDEAVAWFRAMGRDQQRVVLKTAFPD